MKLFCLSFFFLALIGCSSSPLTLTPTQYTYSGKERTRDLDKENPKLEPTITLREIKQSFWGRKAIVDVQGWYSSSGLHARRLNRIQMLEEVEEDQLTLTFYVAPKGGLGKEANLIYGYNYRQVVEIKIPDEIKQLHFKLIEQNLTHKEVLSFKATVPLTDTAS
ncbi:hypothetical protein [Myroides odoratus]|uniref:Lipoprotein n=1 Tax=Myroides odoratus TaxID=256 RepID=A0A378RPE1_MYROD|nr:hypothetical protein [Myroides odoratus]QQU04348.1 hypothetical protein I6I89_03430 [Myroides odoratus]STZ28229.1 Uncharacterised protein [Myroides odoratus]